MPIYQDSTPDLSAIQTLTFTPAQIWNASASENARVILTGNMTSLTIAGAIPGHFYTLMFQQDATGGRTVTLGSAFKFFGGTIPVITTTANAVSIMSAMFDGTVYNTVINNDFK